MPNLTQLVLGTHALVGLTVYYQSMKENDLTDTQRIIGLIETGTATRSDITALLIYLREHLSNDDPIKDIAHCIAHNERDRGIAFSYTEDFIVRFIDCIQNGGILNVGLLFPFEAMIERLITDMHAFGLTINPSKFHQHSDNLCSQMENILEGVSLRLSNPNVVKCEFTTAEDQHHLLLAVNFSGTNILD
jgi:hypothetical protein